MDKVVLNNAEIKLITLAIIELHLSECTSEWVSQQKILFHRIFFKILQQFHGMVRINLKTFFGSAIPNQY